MKLTVKQMHGLLKHKDSPYIRAVGFLYLRYAGDPKTLWNWFEPYIKDDEDPVEGRQQWAYMCVICFSDSTTSIPFSLVFLFLS
uniref:Pre-mRNA-splicing factor 38 n=1 Tax=Salix viminalis TaxID=40686 RepID=A0A6N2MER2_SALVM